MKRKASARGRPVLAVYCRCPEKRGAECRLAAIVGETLARQFGTLCVDLLQRELPLLTDTFDLAICPSREEDRDWAARLVGGTNHVLPQRGANLGERLEASVEELRALGYRHVVFIGADAPSLPLPYLRVLRRILYEKDIVLGPARDGGIYAIGTRVGFPPIRDVAWGTDGVFGQLMERFVRHDHAVGIGAPWYDVIDLDGLQRAGEDLVRSPSLARQMLGSWINDSLARREAMGGVLRESP